MNLVYWQETWINALLDNEASTHLLDLTQEKNHRRLSVYKNNCRQALIQCLQQTYPICLSILGEDCFNSIAIEYSKNYSMLNNDMNRYGGDFFDHISQVVQQRSEFSGFEYLPDLCRLEWFLQSCYYAKPRQRFNFQRYSDLNNDQQSRAIFLLSDDVYLLNSQFPIYEIWQKYQISLSELKVENWCEEFYFCVFRDGYRGRVERIKKEIFQLFKAVNKGYCLIELADYGYAIENISELIKRGWVKDFQVKQ